MTDETNQNDDSQIAEETTAGDQQAAAPDTSTASAPESEVKETQGETTDAGKTAKSALEAISEGIGEAFAPRKITSKAELTPEQKAAEEKAAREKIEQEDAEQAEKGQLRGPDGKFRAMTAEEKKAYEDKKAADAAAAAKPDAVNDPIPKDLNERTATRMKELIQTVKEQAALAEQHNALFGAIQATGATPDEFADMITYMRFAHTNDPASLQTAYKLLQRELSALAVRLGQPIPEVNLLRDPANKDLVDEVNAGKLTAQRAHELAAARAAKGATEATAKRAGEAATAKEQAEAATKAGRTELDALDAELRARDGNETFQRKYDILVPQLKNLFSRLDPRQWKETFIDCYENLKLPALPAAAAPASTGKPQPIRPKAPAGTSGGTSAPKTALEAISQALDGV